MIEWAGRTRQLNHLLTLRGKIRKSAKIRARTFIRAALICGMAVSALALGPVAAHASTTLSASSGQVWGSSSTSAESAAESQAHGELTLLAESKGYSTCINVTYNDTLFYIVPGGGGYVYESTATGLCGTQVFQ